MRTKEDPVIRVDIPAGPQSEDGGLSELTRRIGEVLHYIWDPIGVSCIVEARDEYDMYVPQVVGLLNSKATSKEVAAFLTRIETERMGLMSDPERADRAAALACQWFNDLMSKGSQTS